MRRLQILHVIGGGEFGGAERQILNLASAIDQQKVFLHVCCLFTAPFLQVAEEHGLSAVAVPMKHKLDFSVAGRLYSLIREKHIDLVHTHGVRANLLGRMAAKLSGKPVITTVHSRLAFDYPGLLSRTVNSWTERATRGLTDHFIAVSRGLREALLNEGVPDKKITVIYNGLDVDEFKPPEERGRFRRSLKLADDVPLVAVIGRMHPVKGHRFFLEAAVEVLASKPEVRFLLIGSGPERQVLQELVGELKITDRVIFTGFIEDIVSVLADIDVLAIPSLSEGLPVTAIEAMSSFVPVVATSVGGLPEVIQDCRTGLLVNPGSAEALARGILWVLNNRAEAQEMARRGYATVENNFSARSMARGTEGVYQKIFRSYVKED
ncbi:MAG: glycosyltransferase [Desulfotomaculaceae bacterium]